MLVCKISILDKQQWIKNRVYIGLSKEKLNKARLIRDIEIYG